MLAKRIAIDSALAELKTICYTIKQKLPYLEDTRDQDQEQETPATNGLGETNFGFRMLQSLGWTPGQGLTDGARTEPVAITYKRSRAGLGSEDNTNKEDYKAMLQEFAAKSDFFDLVFEPSVSIEDRKKIHSLANIYGLRTKSYTTADKQRRLVVSKKIDMFELGSLLLNGGLAADDALLQKYELIPPQTDDDGDAIVESGGP